MPSDELDEATVRAIARDEFVRTSRTVVGRVCWTLLSAFAVLVGLQLFQFALYAVSVPVMVAFALVGALVTGSGLYLLYLLWA
jgi:hypothetical protein